jgi:hypothetical protein
MLGSASGQVGFAAAAPAGEELMMGEAAFVISDADDGLRERLSQEISASTSRRPDWPTARCWVSPSGKTEVPARGAGRVDVGRLRLHRAGWRIGWVLVHLGWLCRAKLVHRL